jgi:hypothetical protein
MQSSRWSGGRRLGRENRLTRRANHRHISIIPSFCKTPFGPSGQRCPARLHRLARGGPARVLPTSACQCACPRGYRRERNARPQQGHGNRRNHSNTRAAAVPQLILPSLGYSVDHSDPERPRETLQFETPAERFSACVASTG